MSEISKECAGGTGASGGIEYKFKFWSEAPNVSGIKGKMISAPDESIFVVTGSSLTSSYEINSLMSIAQGSYPVMCNLVTPSIREVSSTTFINILPIFLYSCGTVNADAENICWFDGNEWKQAHLRDIHTTEDTALEVTVVYVPPKE